MVISFVYSQILYHKEIDSDINCDLFSTWKGHVP